MLKTAVSMVFVMQNSGVGWIFNLEKEWAWMLMLKFEEWRVCRSVILWNKKWENIKFLRSSTSTLKWIPEIAT